MCSSVRTTEANVPCLSVQFPAGILGLGLGLALRPENVGLGIGLGSLGLGLDS